MGLSLTLLAGIALTLLANSNIIQTGPGFPWKGVLNSLGEALIVAVVLSLLVDPLAQHQLAVEWGRDLYWSIFSPDAPDDFKEGLQALAAPSGYIRRCTYEINLSRSDNRRDDTVELEVLVRAEGVVLDRRGFRPLDTVFVFARHDGTPSEYKLWSFRSRHTKGVEYSGRDLQLLNALKIQSSGRTVLDQSTLTDAAKIPFRGEYENLRKVATTRRRSDYFPLFQNRVVLEQVFLIRGDAVDDLDISIVQLGGVTLDKNVEVRPDGSKVIEYRTSAVAFPGQASMLEWRPWQVADNA
ncbi:hypothetical protein [Actinoplanes auranticolor]|uniref:hypothetical protein n=1 Tax=Actinoplanes auranticolor TaxID=47988 RepID=UPI001BB3408E|nr:hypothetical protein [Actinoplanes auranticolor]